MRVQVVLLCEDEQLACFGRRFLKELGYKAYQLREEKPTPGKGFCGAMGAKPNAHRTESNAGCQ